jgi:hypothetical protein
MKAVRIIVGALLGLSIFIAAVNIRDYIYEAHIRANIGRITVGMPAKEVISILGKPTSRAISDIPGEYWCYGSDSWMANETEEYCGSILIEMSSVNEDQAHVVKAPSVSKSPQ